jgi:hypothetical protein
MIPVYTILIQFIMNLAEKAGIDIIPSSFKKKED